MSKGTIKNEFQELRSIINEWDFLSVMPGEGGPEDEYEDLVNMVLSFLHSPDSNFTIIPPDQIMLNEFLVNKIKGHFGMNEYAVNFPERIEEHSKKIFAWWQGVKNRK